MWKMTGKIFTTNFRVYYEDTDAGNVVYYANYLKFAERARTEMLRQAGIHQSDLIKSDGVLFVVKTFTGDLKKPARLDDMLRIETTIQEIGGASFSLRQDFYREKELLAA